MEEIGPALYKMFLNDKALEHPKHLYKYYNDSPNSLNALLEGYFYFPAPKNLNDPFECLINREKYIINSASNKEGIIRHRENIGICSFSLTNDNPLMWGHYTDNYRGFCLKFDNEVIKANNNLSLKTHVSYLKNYQPANDSLQKAINDIRNSSLDDKLKNTLHIHLTSAFEYCWKQFDWNYEREYRYLSLTANEFNRKYKFNKKCLREVYVDYRMRSRNRNTFNLLMFILKKSYPHVKVFEVTPNPLVVKLDFNPIKLELEP